MVKFYMDIITTDDRKLTISVPIEIESGNSKDDLFKDYTGFECKGILRTYIKNTLK